MFILTILYLGSLSLFKHNNVGSTICTVCETGTICHKMADLPESLWTHGEPEDGQTHLLYIIIIIHSNTQTWLDRAKTQFNKFNTTLTNTIE